MKIRKLVWVCCGILYIPLYYSGGPHPGGFDPKIRRRWSFQGFPQQMCIRGHDWKLTAAVVFGGQPGSRYDAVVLHVGCSNVVPGSTALGVASQYKILIEAVKDKYPAAVIYLSAIIPEPCEPSASFLIQFINELSCIIAAKMGCIFLATYKRFRAGQSVNSALFSRSDFLHINGAGVSRWVASSGNKQTLGELVCWGSKPSWGCRSWRLR